MSEQVIDGLTDEKDACIGDSVLWVMGPEKGRERYGAVVTDRTGPGLLSLNIVSPGVPYFILRKNVPHVSVPFKPKEAADEHGRWRHTDEHMKRLRQIAKAEQLVADAERLGVQPRTLLEQRQAEAAAASEGVNGV